MIILKKFNSEQMLQDYMYRNMHLKVLDTVGIGDAVVLLTDEFNITNRETVCDYIDSEHYEDTNFHYKAYYNEY